MHDVSGVSGAAPVWREVMDWLHRGQRNASRAPLAPAGVIRRDIRFDPPDRVKESPRAEWFLAGTERSVVRLADARALAHIAYPGQGTIIALDPDIPPGRQSIALQLSGTAGGDWQWTIDGRRLGRAAGFLRWRPSPGHHRLAVVDGALHELEAVTFEVRALRGKRQP